jgi:hypothetical protein
VRGRPSRRGWPALLAGLPAVSCLVSDARTPPRPHGVETIRDLPSSFEANRGQTDPQVAFVARGTGHTVFITPREAVLVLPARDSLSVALRLSFVGANLRPRIVGLEELPGRANYFVGRDPAEWRRDVPRYARVQYTGLYPGIDVRLSHDPGGLASEFVVHPRADPGRIVLAWQGADSLEVDSQGDLVLYTAAGAVRQRRLMIYQDSDGQRRQIAGRYVHPAAQRVRFEVAAYDASWPLVINGTVPLALLPTQLP